MVFFRENVEAFLEVGRGDGGRDAEDLVVGWFGVLKGTWASSEWPLS